LNEFLIGLKSAMIEEKKVYEELLSIADEKKKALIKNDTERMDEFVKLEKKAMKDARALNSKTIEILDAIAHAHQLDHNPDLSEIISLIQEEEERESIRRMQAEFQQTIQDLMTRNELNQRLIETQLEYMAFCLELFTQGDPMGEMYGYDGHVSEDHMVRKGLLDQEV
jgi:flagellar biosynthesis/type III secretory pathway chaperone